MDDEVENNDRDASELEDRNIACALAGKTSHRRAAYMEVLSKRPAV